MLVSADKFNFDANQNFQSARAFGGTDNSVILERWNMRRIVSVNFCCLVHVNLFSYAVCQRRVGPAEVGTTMLSNVCPYLRIKAKILRPIVQGGMGLGISSVSTGWPIICAKTSNWRLAKARARPVGFDSPHQCGLCDDIESSGQFFIDSQLAFALAGDVTRGLFLMDLCACSLVTQSVR